MVFLRFFMVVFSRDRFRKSIRTARNYGRFSTIMANYEKLWKIMVVFRAFTSVFRDITGVPGLAPRKQLHFSKKCRKGVHSRKEVVNYAQNPRCCDLVPKADYNVHFWWVKPAQQTCANLFHSIHGLSFSQASSKSKVLYTPTGLSRAQLKRHPSYKAFVHIIAIIESNWRIQIIYKRTGRSGRQAVGMQSPVRPRR